MSIYHVNQLEHKLKTLFHDLIDMSDYVGKPAPERHDCFLSRSVCAYALTIEAGLTPDLAAARVTDGHNDNGIDAVYVRQTDKESVTLHLVQSKWSKDGNSSPDLDAVGKFLRGITNLLEQKFDKFNDKIGSYKEVITNALLDPNCKVVAMLVHSSSQKLGSHPQREIDEFCENVNDTTEFLEFMIIDQGDLFKSLANGGSAPKIDLGIEIVEWGKKEEPHFAVYGMVDAKQVAVWWDTYEARLFGKNLRGILGETSVNKEIRETLEKFPEKFWYFNNGITIVADTIKRGPYNATNRALANFQCNGASIVNGAQTVSTVGRYFKKGVKDPVGAMIPLRVISTEGALDFDIEITKANNTQNRIEGRDFAAVDEQQQRLRLELSILKVNYQLIRGEGFVAGPRSFDVEEAITALACATGNPDLAVLVKREIGKFWESTKKPPYTDVIRSSVHGQYVLNVVITHRKTEEILNDLGQKTAVPRGNSILVWGNKIVSSIIFSKIEPPLLQGMTESLESFVYGNSFREAVGTVANSLVNEVETNYPGYIANTFKNPGKSKEIYGLVSAEVGRLF